MRGTVVGEGVVDLQIRITPAHAGNSSLKFIIYFKPGDHPRPCGEQKNGKEIYEGDIGSPPPMRGTVFNLQSLNIIGRITPAHAGNSISARHLTKPYQDHPRPCGEQDYAVDLSNNPLGSPPPMRGTVYGAWAQP